MSTYEVSFKSGNKQVFSGEISPDNILTLTNTPNGYLQMNDGFIAFAAVEYIKLVGQSRSAGPVVPPSPEIIKKQKEIEFEKTLRTPEKIIERAKGNL